VRFLAIDLGGKRTGLASGDDLTGIVQPLKVIEAAPGDHLLRLVRREIEEHGPDAIVVGLPLNMDGTEGPSAAAVRAFAARIGEACGVGIRFQDERLSSFAAESHLDRSGRTHREKKEIRDALAAAEILRDHLRERARRGEGPETSGE
jgi:putative Holliday junction resolvase